MSKNIIGTKHSDTLHAEAANAYGRRGDDVLFGSGDAFLRGGRGDDILVGGAGKVTMKGGRGDDTFAFHIDYIDGTMDKIKDFKSGKDMIAIGEDWFGRQALDANQFVNGSVALDADDRALYDNGRIYFDHDGVGGDDAVLVAKVKGSPALDHGDFLIG